MYMERRIVLLLTSLIIVSGITYIYVKQDTLSLKHDIMADNTEQDTVAVPDISDLQHSSDIPEIEIPKGLNNTDESAETAQSINTVQPVYADTIVNDQSEGAQPMEHPDRTTYQDGFTYEPITDEIKERIYGLSYKEDCTVPYEELRYVKVLYTNFDGETDEGEIICNKAIAQDLVEIFYQLYENHYPIEKIRLVDEYEADDDLSCAANNTSSFNYRVVAGSRTLSKHALGMAIDINPFYNPYITYPGGKEHISPPGSEPYANRAADLPYMIQKGDLCYNLFIEHGFTWGGEWKSVKDYQHFQKE